MLARGRLRAEAARERVLDLFGDDRDRVTRFGRELIYRLVEDRTVRDEVLPPAAEAPGHARYPALAAVASPALRDA